MGKRFTEKHGKEEQRAFFRDGHKETQYDPRLSSTWNLPVRKTDQKQLKEMHTLVKELEKDLKSLPPGWDSGLDYITEEEFCKILDSVVRDVNKRKNPWD